MNGSKASELRTSDIPADRSEAEQKRLVVISSWDFEEMKVARGADRDTIAAPR